MIQKGSTFLEGFCHCIVGLPEEPCASHLPTSEDLVAAAAVAEVSPSSSTSSVSTDNDSLRQPEAEAEASTSETKEKAKTKRNRCFMCRKKVGLTGEYRLLIVFLMLMRSPVKQSQTTDCDHCHGCFAVFNLQLFCLDANNVSEMDKMIFIL